MERFSVVVKVAGADHFAMLRALRRIGGLGLREAKDLSEWLAGREGCVLVVEVMREAAERVAEEVVRAGGQAAVEPSAVEAPMMVRPGLETGWRGSILGMVQRWM